MSFLIFGVVALLFYENLHVRLNIGAFVISQQRWIWSRMLKATEQYFNLLPEVLCLSFLSSIGCRCVTWWRVLRVIVRRSLRFQSWQQACCLAKSERLNNVDRRGWSGTKHIILKVPLRNKGYTGWVQTHQKENNSEVWDTLRRRQ